MSDQLQILGVRVQPATAVSEEDAAHHVQERLHVLVDVENSSQATLHVWSARRAFEYDATTHVLTLHLAEAEPKLPPDIVLISDHPRVPSQVTVEAGARATIDVPVPTTVRRRVPGEGLGMSFVEEPIRQIDQVALHVQFADVPFQQVVGESPSDHRDRLRAHGHVVRTTLKPTGKRSSKR
jgi:hypothetical protein